MAAGAGAFGPYQRGAKWIVTIRAVAGSSGTSRSFDAESDAIRFRDDHRAALASVRVGRKTVGDAIDDYADHLEAEGHKQRTETIRRCRAFFAPDLKMPLRSLTPTRCASLYSDAVKRRATRWVGSGKKRRLVELEQPVSPNTHRGMLTHAKTFLGWCVGQRWLRANPLADVKPRARLRHGKPQLRIDEARKWYDAAMVLARRPADPKRPIEAGAVAALCALVLGMRATEIVSRQARDLDDEGRLLWIPWSKTEAGRRTLEVPAEIRPLLVALGKDKAPEALLFGTDLRGRPHRRGWPLFWVGRVCEVAGVLQVSAHSMRGLHATLALQAGATSQLVASALGHASDAVTLGSYAAPGSADEAKRRKGLGVIQGGKGRGR